MDAKDVWPRWLKQLAKEHQFIEEQMAEVEAMLPEIAEDMLDQHMDIFDDQLPPPSKKRPPMTRKQRVVLKCQTCQIYSECEVTVIEQPGFELQDMNLVMCQSCLNNDTPLSQDDWDSLWFANDD